MAQDRAHVDSVPTSTHDTRRAKYHVKELGAFARQVEEVRTSSAFILIHLYASTRISQILIHT